MWPFLTLLASAFSHCSKKLLVNRPEVVSVIVVVGGVGILADVATRGDDAPLVSNTVTVSNACSAASDLAMTGRVSILSCYRLASSKNSSTSHSGPGGVARNVHWLHDPTDPWFRWSKGAIVVQDKVHGLKEDLVMVFGQGNMDEFEWQAVKRSSRPTKMSKLLYTRFTKLIIDYILYTTRVFLTYQILIPDAMISDAIKKKEGYTYYMAKKVESEKAKIVDELEEQHVSPVKSGRGKGFMYYGDQVVNAPNKLKNDVVLRKTRSLTIAEE
ncbi:hypothetical protein Tco_0401335 [Tanacetum coccineum]